MIVRLTASPSLPSPPMASAVASVALLSHWHQLRSVEGRLGSDILDNYWSGSHVRDNSSPGASPPKTTGGRGLHSANRS